MYEFIWSYSMVSSTVTTYTTLWGPQACITRKITLSPKLPKYVFSHLTTIFFIFVVTQCAYNLCVFIQYICRKYHRSHQIHKVHLPSSFSSREGQWPDLSKSMKKHLTSKSCHSVELCPVYTWVFVWDVKEDQNRY